MLYYYGKNPLKEVLKATRRRVRQVFLIGQNKKPQDPDLVSLVQSHQIPYQLCSRNQLDEKTGGASHQGVVFEADFYPFFDPQEILKTSSQKNLLLMCDSIQDPQNFGTLCRSAHCFGVDGVIIQKDRASGVTPAVCKASAGAVEHLKIAQVTNLSHCLEELKKEGFWVYAADLDGTQTLNQVDPSEKSVVVLGSEGKGIRPLVLKNCDFKFKIPMAGNFDSLNVAQAGTVVLYEFFRKMIS